MRGGLDCGLIRLKFEGFLKKDHGSPNLGRPRARSNGREKQGDVARWLAAVWAQDSYRKMDDLEDGIWNPKTSNPVEVRAWIRIHMQLQHMCIMDNY